jgi:tRNA(Ile)-lysidine synthase
VTQVLVEFNRSVFGVGERVLVALSGGVDSMALLHLLVNSQANLGIEVTAAHLHHGMRGGEADADVEILSRVCREWNVPLLIGHADVPALAAERKISVEQAGRDARYEFFEATAAQQGCGKVATAHHADDQVETVLLHLFRGAGIDGLAGMPESRLLSSRPHAPILVRPLLRVARADLEAYCQAHQLLTLHDATNDDVSFRRNRIRSLLLPELASYDPAIGRHLLRLAEQAREEQELLEPAVTELLARATVPTATPGWAIPLPPPPVQLRLNAQILASAPAALARRALRRALRQAAGYALELDAALVERLREMLTGGPPAIDLPGCAFEARRVEGHLVVRCTHALRVPAPVPVAAPGSTEAPEFGLRIEATELPPPAELRTLPAEAILNPAMLRGSLTLRSPQTGERIKPFNAPGQRLLSDLFIDRKVPAYYRPLWPVLADEEGPVWVLGLVVAHRARVEPGASLVYHLQARNLDRG